MAEKLYFAYGSNINLEQMEYRCPAAKAVGPVILENYELLFRGNTRGNGVATIAPREGSKVHGLLWWITPACEQSLDFYEGYPRLYEKEQVTVRDDKGSQFTVMAYVMTGDERWMSPTMPLCVLLPRHPGRLPPERIACGGTEKGMGTLRPGSGSGDSADQPDGW